MKETRPRDLWLQTLVYKRRQKWKSGKNISEDLNNEVLNAKRTCGFIILVKSEFNIFWCISRTR